MGDVVKLVGHLRTARRNVRRLKKPAVIPLKPAIQSFRPNTVELVPAGLKLAGLPLRDGALRDLSDLRQLRLGQLENGLSDMKHRRHDPTICENEFIRQGILCDNAFPIPLPLSSEGKMEVDQIITTIMTVKGWKQKKLAKEIGVSQGQVSKWVNSGHSPNLRQWNAVLDILEADPRLVHLLNSWRAPTIPGVGPEFYTAFRKMSASARARIVNLVIGLAEDEVA